MNGTRALKSESAGRELGAGPWLAAVLVGKGYQGKGVGTALATPAKESMT